MKASYFAAQLSQGYFQLFVFEIRRLLRHCSYPLLRHTNLIRKVPQRYQSANGVLSVTQSNRPSSALGFLTPFGLKSYAFRRRFARAMIPSISAQSKVASSSSCTLSAMRRAASVMAALVDLPAALLSRGSSNTSPADPKQSRKPQAFNSCLCENSIAAFRFKNACASLFVCTHCRLVFSKAPPATFWMYTVT